jgi:hypothetical protein
VAELHLCRVFFNAFCTSLSKKQWKMNTKRP